MEELYKNQSLDIKCTGKDKYTITVPFKNGFRSFEANTAIVNFLENLPSSQSRDTLLKHISQYFKLDEQQALEILEKRLLKSKLLLESEESTKDTTKSNGVLLFRQQLLNANVVNHVSWLLTVFCRKPFVMIFATLSIAFQVWLLSYYFGLGELAINEANARPLTAFTLILLGLFIHELGHAACAFKFGCRKVTIGFGWYVIFFVMLADLSESWALNRRQRLLINLAGGYFQSLYILLLGVIWHINDSPACLIAAIALCIYNILNLNPFFRLDGYWIVSDWLDIKNLRSKATEHLKTVLFNPSTAPQAISRSSNYLNLYTLGLLLFLPAFYSYVFLALVPYSIETLHTEMTNLYNDFGNYPLGYNLISVFFCSMILVFSGMLSLRFCRNGYLFLMRSFQIKRLSGSESN